MYRLLGGLDELSDGFRAVNFPEDVLNNWVVFKHRQNFQVVLMLAEELFPEGETVDALPLALSVLIDECGRNALLTLDQTSGHE